MIWIIFSLFFLFLLISFLLRSFIRSVKFACLYSLSFFLLERLFCAMLKIFNLENKKKFYILFYPSLNRFCLSSETFPEVIPLSLDFAFYIHKINIFSPNKTEWNKDPIHKFFTFFVQVLKRFVSFFLNHHNHFNTHKIYVFNFKW